MTEKPDTRVVKLEDERLQQRDRRIAELRRELDEARDLVRRMQEHVEDRSGIDRWIEALGEDWTPFMKRDVIPRRLNVLLEDKAKLLKEAKGLIAKE